MTVRSTLLTTCLVIAALATVAASSAGPSPVPIRVNAHALSLEPMPGFTHGMLTVRLRGVGIVYEHGFNPEGGLNYRLETDKGELLADGRYVFEVWMAGSSSGTHKLGGSFEIVGGAISSDTLEADVKQEIIDVPIAGDAIVEGSICVSDSVDCLVGTVVLLEPETFDTPGFGAADIKIKDNVPEIWFADTTSADGDFAITVEDSRFFIRDPDADTLPFTIESGAASNSVYITDTGFTGIRTSVPNAALHVNASGVMLPTGDAAVVEGGTLRITRPGNSANIRFVTSGGAAGHQAWTFTNNVETGRFEIRNATSGASPVLVYPDAQAQLLHVRGDHINVNGRILVNNNQVHPDYVFDEGYDLMSLPVLEAYIQENGHLPGVQSAADVKSEGGMDLSRLSLDLLEKVEELTLHTIAQNKTIEQQHNAIEQLNTDKAALEQRLARVEQLLTP